MGTANLQPPRIYSSGCIIAVTQACLVGQRRRISADPTLDWHSKLLVLQCFEKRLNGEDDFTGIVQDWVVIYTKERVFFSVAEGWLEEERVLLHGAERGVERRRGIGLSLAELRGWSRLQLRPL